MGKEELIEDPRYETNELRCENYLPDLQNTIREFTLEYTKAELEEMMAEAGVPCGPVLDVAEAINHPHIKARDMIVEVDHPTMGKVKMQGIVPKLSESPGQINFASPLLGQHNREVFNLTEEEEKQLKEEGVI